MTIRQEHLGGSAPTSTVTRSGRDARGRFVKGLAGAERDAEAIRLRTRGETYQAISDALGYGGHQNARRAIQAALAEVTREAAEENVTLQLERLDFMYRSTLAVLEAKHFTVSEGRIVYLGDPRNPDKVEPLLDDGPVLKAVDRLLKIEERRAKLLGLDAPTKSHVTHASTHDVDAAVAELAAELALRAEAGS